MASHLCVSLPVLPAALSPTLGPVLRDQVPEPAVGRDGPVWSLPPGIVPASGSGACGGFGPLRSGALPAVGVVAPRRQPQPLCSPGKQLPISRSGQLPQGQKLKNKQKPKLLMTCGWRGLRVLPPGARRKGWQPPRSSLAPTPEPGLAPGLRAAPTASPPQEPDCRLRRH